MSNVHGLFSGKNDDSSDEGDEQRRGDDDANNRYVGGIGDHGGGRCGNECLRQYLSLSPCPTRHADNPA